MPAFEMLEPLYSMAIRLDRVADCNLPNCLRDHLLTMNPPTMKREPCYRQLLYPNSRRLQRAGERQW